MVRAAQNAHEIGRLHEKAIQMVGGRQDRLIEDLDHFEAAPDAASPSACGRGLRFRQLVLRDVLRILHQKRDFAIGVEDRDMGAAPGPLLGSVRPDDWIMQHGQNVGDSRVAHAFEGLLQPTAAFPLGGKGFEHVAAKKALALPPGHFEIGLVHRDDVEVSVHDHRWDEQAVEHSLEIHVIDDFTKNHEQWTMAAD